jgi:hypothetical protein
MRKISLLAIILLFGSLAFPSASLGVMSSTNYTIFADSIDSGGALSASGTYSLEDTLGESAPSSTASSGFEILGGYQYMDWSVLAIEVDTANVDLGNLTVAQVANSSVVVSVTADADSGYVLSVGSTGGTSLAPVSDGAVTAGDEEYGVAVAGTDAVFADDRAVVAGLNLSASSTAVTFAQTSLIFKAAMSASTATGARSQSITLSASTNI